MAQQAQTYSTHVRRPPLLLLVGVILLVANVLRAMWNLAQNPGGSGLWDLLVAVALVAVALSIRSHANRVQDRVIRLEERLRLASLVPDDLRGKIGDLTPGQLVALRFASDEEVPELTRRTLAGEFQKPAEIKRQVKNWRGDYLRV